MTPLIHAECDRYRVRLYRDKPRRHPPVPFVGLVLYETPLAALIRRVRTRAYKHQLKNEQT